MWKIFKKDPYKKIARKRRQAERRKLNARKKFMHRKERADAWRNFKKSINAFFVSVFEFKKEKSENHENRRRRTHKETPFINFDPKSQVEVQKHKQARIKSLRRKQRNDEWSKLKSKITVFLAHPFAGKEVRKMHYNSLRRRLLKDDPLAAIDQQKLLESKLRSQARKKEYVKKRQSQERGEIWAKFTKRFLKFIANPFANRDLNSLERRMKQIKSIEKHDRKVAREKWYSKFRENPWKALFPRKKRRAEGGGYLYIYNMTSAERKALKKKERKEILANFTKLVTTSEIRKKFGLSFLYSTAYFVLAFLLTYVVYQLVTIIIASSFNIPVIWYFYKLKFAISDYDPLYTRTNLVLIFAAGPIISLMLAFVFLKLYFSTHKILKRFKLFYLWGFICGCNMFFGAYIAGFFTRTEFIFVSEWLFLSNVFDIEEIIFTAIAFVAMLVIGWQATPLFLISSSSTTLIRSEFRLFFVISQVILPWLAGVVILFLITLPTFYIPLILKTITPGLALIPVMLNFDATKYKNIHKQGVMQKNYFKWSLIILVVALLFFYRVVLNFGLRLL